MGFFIRYFRSILSILKDKSSPLWKKVLIVFGIIYLVSPIEIMPDFLLPIGFLDDIILWILILFIIGNPLKSNMKNSDYKKKFRGKNIVETEDYHVEED